jgi:type IV fimbrial biogenesis protein FimT
MKPVSRTAGVSLMEAMLTMAIAAIVMTLAVPAFSDWVSNAAVRSSAEALQAALQSARAEAVLRNATVRLKLTDSTGLPAWSFGCARVSAQCPALIRQQPVGTETVARIGTALSVPQSALAASLLHALAAGSGMPAGVTFDALGAVSAATVATDMARIDITHASSTAARRLVILISSGGMIRLCDPASTTLTRCS